MPDQRNTYNYQNALPLPTKATSWAYQARVGTSTVMEQRSG